MTVRILRLKTILFSVAFGTACSAAEAPGDAVDKLCFGDSCAQLKGPQVAVSFSYLEMLSRKYRNDSFEAYAITNPLTGSVTNSLKGNSQYVFNRERNIVVAPYKKWKDNFPYMEEAEKSGQMQILPPLVAKTTLLMLEGFRKLSSKVRENEAFLLRISQKREDDTQPITGGDSMAFTPGSPLPNLLKKALLANPRCDKESAAVVVASGQELRQSQSELWEQFDQWTTGYPALNGAFAYKPNFWDKAGQLFETLRQRSYDYLASDGLNPMLAAQVAISIVVAIISWSSGLLASADDPKVKQAIQSLPDSKLEEIASQSGVPTSSLKKVLAHLASQRPNA